MDEFLSLYVLLKFSPEDTSNLNRFITVNETGTVAKASTRRSQGPLSFTVEFYQTFEDNLNTNSSRRVPGKKQEKEQNQTHSLEPALFGYPNQKKNTKKETRICIDVKILNKIPVN